MKVAHFGVFAPYASGQFETVRDLIKAERIVGIEAGFIDYGADGNPASRVGLKDEGLESLPIDWAENADLFVRHSAIPKEIKNNIPIITALHGRPENSLLLEHYGKSSVISEVRKLKTSFITFWEEFVFQWKCMLNGNGGDLFYVSPPLDISRYENIEPHLFADDENGEPNIMIADLWREDVSPFNVLMSAIYYKEHFNKKAKIHIYSVPKGKGFDFLLDLKKSGMMGEVKPHIRGLESRYASADIVLTPHIIATRIIREAMASGLPIVAGEGCRYTDYSADPRNIPLFASKIDECWQMVKGNKLYFSNVQKKTAIKEFGLEKIGKEIRGVFEKVIEGGKAVKGQIQITQTQFEALGKKYCQQICEVEHKILKDKRRNERAIEYQFVFKNLVEMYPSTVLDVGSGMSSLPHLIGLGGFEVDSIDNTDKSCWPQGMSNRHFLVNHDDITNTKVEKKYDFITCISTLEHIKEHNRAVFSMLSLLNPGGRLIMTFPYNEYSYVENVYKMDGAGYGQNWPYICQVFSRYEIDLWINSASVSGIDCYVLEQEYWKVFNGPYWTFDGQNYPPEKITKDKLHQFTCLLLERK